MLSEKSTGAFFLIFLLQPFFCIAQHRKSVRDFGCHAGIVLEKKIFTDYKVEVEQQVRTFHNSSNLDDYFLHVGLKYTVNKRIRLGGGVRYIYDVKRSEVKQNNWRYNLDIDYRNKLFNLVKINYRLRYQQEYVNLFEAKSQNKKTTSAIRNKLCLKYSINKMHVAAISCELFRQIETYRRPYFNKLRSEAGCETQTSIGKFEYALGMENELNSNHPYTFYYFKLLYILSL